MDKYLVAAFLIIINCIALAAMGADKKRAIKGKRRISERTLLLLAAFAGSPGIYAGMRLFRHKTLHKKFKYGVPVIFFTEIALFILLLVAYPALFNTWN